MLPKETVGRVRAVLIEMLTNDNKEDEDIEDDDKEGDDKEDDDKDDKDVHQLHNKTKKKNVEVSTYSIAAVLGFQEQI